MSVMAGKAKKILMLCYYFPPDSNSGSFRPLYFANHLVTTKKWLPIVVAPSPKYYGNAQRQDATLIEKILPGIKVIRTRNIHLREGFLSFRQRFSKNRKKVSATGGTAERAQQAGSLLQRIKDVISDEILAFPDRQVGWLPFAITAGFRAGREHSIDIIYATGSPWTNYLAGVLLKKLLKKPLVLDYRDPWNQNPFSERRTRVYTNLSRRLERMLLKQADEVICNTETLKQYIVQASDGAARCRVITNGFEEADLADSVTDNNKHRSNGKPERFVFIHTGNLYGQRSVEQFVRGATVFLRKHTSKDIQFWFVGDSSLDLRSYLTEIVGTDLYQRHFWIEDRVEHAVCVSYMRQAQCCILFQQGTTVQVPRKLYEYIGLSKPILAITPKEGETAKILLDNELGFVVDDDQHEIAHALDCLYRQPSSPQNGSLARSAIQKFSNTHLCGQFHDTLESLV